MLKEKIKSSIDNTLNIATIAYQCVGATIDTINDPKVKDAWAEKKYNCSEINKKHKKELKRLYKDFVAKVKSANKSAKLAKREVNLQFNGTVKSIFTGHLKKRRNKAVAHKRTAKASV